MGPKPHLAVVLIGKTYLFRQRGGHESFGPYGSSVLFKRYPLGTAHHPPPWSPCLWITLERSTPRALDSVAVAWARLGTEVRILCPGAIKRDAGADRLGTDDQVPKLGW